MRNTARPRKTTDRSISMAELLCLGLESTNGAVWREEETFLTWFLESNVHPSVIEHFLVCCHSTNFHFCGSRLHIIYAIFLSVCWVYFSFVMFCPCICPPSSASSLPALTLITLKHGPLSFLLPAFCGVPLWVWIQVYRILTALANLPVYLLVLSTRMNWIDFF